MQHDYYSQIEAADYLGMPLYTLNHCRAHGDAPDAIKWARVRHRALYTGARHWTAG